jgi:hypothetical protein
MDKLKIDVWYGKKQRFGHNGAPSPYINILGRVSSPDTVHALGYQLNKGEFKVLPLGPTAFRLLGDGDFNVELPCDALKEGNNILHLLATDRAGNETREEVQIEYTRGKTWPLPCEVDWGSGTSSNDMAQVIDGKWELTKDGLHCVEIGYDRLVGMGEVTWQDYQVTVPLTIHRFSDKPTAFCWPSNGNGPGILLRWQGHADWGDIKPNRGYLPHGAIGFYIWRKNPDRHRWILYSGSDGSTLTEDPEHAQMELNKRYLVKMSVQSQKNKPSIYRLQCWKEGEAEPAGWLLEAENGPKELKQGSLVLVSHHAEVTFGKVIVEPV